MKIRRRLGLFVVVVLAMAASYINLSTPAAHAYTNSRLIDDAVFNRVGSMNQNQIQAFLNNPNSNGAPSTCLASYTDQNIYYDGTNYHFGNDSNWNPAWGPTQISAAQIIAQSAQTWGINPQVILATLEKEESLIDGTSCASWQYQSAMGYGCPDAGGCSSAYAGFTKQVFYASYQLMFNEQRSEGNLNWQGAGSTHYSGFMTQGTFSRFTGDTPVYYDGNATIDGQVVYMTNGATASLYSYTPHLNQSFPGIFQTWFGSTYASYSVVKNADSSQQYVLDGGTLYPIPSADIISAWDLGNYTSTLASSVIASMPQGATLTRIMRPAGSLGVYFVDGGNRYLFPSVAAINNWGLSVSSIVNVPADLGGSLVDSGLISNSVLAPDGSGIYLMDDGALNHFANPATLQTWGGDNPTNIPLSTVYYSGLSTSGAAITSTLVSDSSTSAVYTINLSTASVLNSGQQGLFAGITPVAVNDTVIATMTQRPFSFFIQHSGDAAVYMIDGGQLHQVGSPDLLSAWSPGSVVTVTPVSIGAISNMTVGSGVTSMIATQGSSAYLMSGQTLSIPTGLQPLYETGNTTYAASSSLLSLYSAGPQAGIFIQTAGQPLVYGLDGGQKRPINSLQDYVLWGGAPGANLILPAGVVNWFGTGSALGSYVSSGGTNYLLNQTGKLTVPSNVQADWGLSNPTAVTTNLLAVATTTGTLATAASSGGAEYLIQNGVAYGTTNGSLEGVWALTGAPAVNSLNIGRLSQQPLTRFARSTSSSDQRIFIVDGSTLYTMSSPAQVYNYGYQGEPIVQVDPSYITSASVSAAMLNDVVVDGSSNYYVVDGGAKKSFASGAAQNQWIQTLTVPTVSSSFLSLLSASSQQITQSVRATNSLSIYAVVSGQADHINSPTTYYATYAPVSSVSPYLTGSLPLGSPIP
jgi:hypothetical protein